ncbi:MAG: UV DNA damage repair endonuclease UvsE [Desulfobacteraceae bacterium]|nr:UV DNA damage repair endonuclease UvsE [Desulfobacteraceae bacterium]
MVRLGLCCLFREAPIKFRRTTAAFLSRMTRRDQLDRLADIAMHNARSLKAALVFCRDRGIGAFRINSQILPLKTHPEVGYAVTDLPDAEAIIRSFVQCGAFARENHLRTSFHPDQFIVLASPDQGVYRRSLADLEYHAEVAGWVGADVINVHGGGAYNDKPATLARLSRRIEKLPAVIRTRLTLENDDRVYTPGDLLPVCERTGVPLAYDVHHHRCLPDGLSEAVVTEKAIATWGREPLFHVSSPLGGRGAPNCRPHHDYIDPGDFPSGWRTLDITVDVEAKAKELAVLKLSDDLQLNTKYP